MLLGNKRAQKHVARGAGILFPFFILLYECPGAIRAIRRLYGTFKY
jgi:hypothetical protein